MRLFKLDDRYTIVCETINTRKGFKHVATLLDNGFEVESTKICYQNRTWESFQYQCVLSRLVYKYFEDAEAEKYNKIINAIRG